MKKADLTFNVLRLPVDMVMLLSAGMATYLLRTRLLDVYRPVLFEFNLPLSRYFTLTVAVSILFLASYAASGLYAMRVRMSTTQELLRVIIASSAAIMAVIVYIFLRQELFNSRFLVLGGWFLAMLCVGAGRLGVRALQRYAVGRHAFGVHRLLLIGTDDISRRIKTALENDPALGYRIVQELADPELPQVAKAVSNPGVDEIMLADPNYSAEKIVRLVDFCHEQHIVFKFVPNIYQTLTTHVGVDTISRIPLIELKRTPLDGWGRVAKRIFDVVAASLALIALSPLFAVVALAIKWETRGPVWVRLRRVSRNKEFDMIKFRSMFAVDSDGTAHSLNAYYRSLGNDRPEGGPLWKMKDDPRITSVGKFIRKYRIDELPQLWNIVTGDMALVGPRPHQSDEISRYAKHHKKVLAIKAGATGLAQASGSSDLPFEEEVVLDTFYIENWSLWFDLKIIFKTAFKMLRDRSAV